MCKTKIVISLFVLAFLGGCIGAAMEGAHIAKDNVKRANNSEAAEKGDKVAQFKMGEAYCCSTDKSGPAYDTVVAVRWLCASAKQGYAPAMYKLGKIYSGDVIDGLRLIRRVTTGVTESMAGSTVSLPISYAWLTLAASNGEEDAAGRLEKINGDMSSAEKKQGAALASQGLSIPCEIKEVFPNS